MENTTNSGHGIDWPIVCLPDRAGCAELVGFETVTRGDGLPFWRATSSDTSKLTCWHCKDLAVNGAWTWVRTCVWGRTDAAGTFTLDPRSFWDGTDTGP